MLEDQLFARRSNGQKLHAVIRHVVQDHHWGCPGQANSLVPLGAARNGGSAPLRAFGCDSSIGKMARIVSGSATSAHRRSSVRSCSLPGFGSGELQVDVRSFERRVMQ